MINREQSRQFDRYVIESLRIPGLVLMENAGRGCAERLLKEIGPAPQLTKASVVVLCGPGNNGGDGFVIARHLWNAGCAVKVVLTGPASAYAGDASIMLAGVAQLPVDLVEFNRDGDQATSRSMLTRVGRREADWIVDAMLGTGAQGPLRPPIQQIIQWTNEASARRFAVDLPSGLDCDSGQPQPIAFRADWTCTMIDRKAGFDAPEAAPWLGQVEVVGIGVDRRAVPGRALIG